VAVRWTAAWESLTWQEEQSLFPLAIAFTTFASALLWQLAQSPV
jgi:hypothetical protein